MGSRKISHSLLRLSHWPNSKTTVSVWIRHLSPTDPNTNCAEKSRRNNSIFLKNQIISTGIYLSFISHTPREHTLLSLSWLFVFEMLIYIWYIYIHTHGIVTKRGVWTVTKLKLE